jgi:hypothetical protein
MDALTPITPIAKQIVVDDGRIVDSDRLALWDDRFSRLTAQPFDGRDRFGKGHANATK